MEKKNNVANELKALGLELANAFRQVKASKEFKDLEKEISTSIKHVSNSLVKSLKAANNSPEAGRIKKRVGRVVKISTEKGKEEAAKAAKIGLKKFNKAFRKLAKKLKPQSPESF